MLTTPHAAPTFMDQLSRIKAEAARAQIDTSRLKRSLDEFLSPAEARDPDIVGFWADESGSESNNSQADRSTPPMETRKGMETTTSGTRGALGHPSLATVRAEWVARGSIRTHRVWHRWVASRKGMSPA